MCKTYQKLDNFLQLLKICDPSSTGFVQLIVRLYSSFYDEILIHSKFISKFLARTYSKNEKKKFNKNELHQNFKSVATHDMCSLLRDNFLFCELEFQN